MSESGDNPYGGPGPYGPNPYGGSGQPNDPNPYGSQPPTPYGSMPPPPGPPPGSPYSPGQFGPPNVPESYRPPEGNDGVSIAALVVSLLGFCTGVGFLVGLVLSIIGFRRTKVRPGRGFAIAGLVISVVGMLIVVALGSLVLYFVRTNISVDNAEVGQCMNIDHSDDSIYLSKKDCTEGHDGEIVYVGDYSVLQSTLSDPTLGSQVDFNDLKANDSTVSYIVCSTLMKNQGASADLAKLGEPGDYRWGFALDEDAQKNPSSSDKFICYVEGAGEKLDRDLLK